MYGAPVWTQLGTSPRGRGVKNRKQRLSEGSKVFASMGSWAAMANGVGQPCDHLNLDGGKDLPSTDSPTPHRKPARKPSASKSGPRGCDLHNPLTDYHPAPRGYQSRRRCRRGRTQSENYEQGANIAV